MKTIRTYRNVAEAGFARSLLEAAGIDASLPHEFAATSGPEFAVWGVQVQVPDEDVARAVAILDGEAGLNPEPDDADAPPPAEESREAPEDGKPARNPYAILILAFPFVLGGIILLLRTGTGVIGFAGGGLRILVDPSTVHGIGVFGLIVGGGLVGYYLYVRGRISGNS